MFLGLQFNNTNTSCWFYVLNIVIEKKNQFSHKIKILGKFGSVVAQWKQITFQEKKQKKTKNMSKMSAFDRGHGICSFKKHKAWFCFKIK